MALLPADIPTGRVVGQFAFLVQDGFDGDTKPDAGAVLGEITFTCSAPLVRFPSKPLTAVPLSFTAELVNDTLTAKGGSPVSDGIELLATDSQLTNPTGFTWNVSFNLRRADTYAPISLPSFDIQVPANSVIDLTTVIPVASSSGVITTQGPKGDAGPQGPQGAPGRDGSNVIPADNAVAGYVGTGSSSTRAALDSVVGTAITDAKRIPKVARSAGTAAPQVSYGHSFLAEQGLADASRYWARQLAASMALTYPTSDGGSTGDLKRAVGGWHIEDVAVRANGNATLGTAPGAKTLYVLQTMMNSARWFGVNAVQQASALNAGRTIMAGINASARIEQDSGAFTFNAGGGWASSQTSASWASGGTFRYASNTGDYFEFTAHATATQYVMLAGKQGAGGTTISVTDQTAGGASLGTIDLSDSVGATTPSISTATFAYAWRVPASAKGHVVRFTKTGGNVMGLDAVFTQSATPPPVLWMKEPYLADYSKSTAYPNGSDGAMDAFNSLIDTLAAEFPNIIVADPNRAGYWDKARHILSDGVHPNDLGHDALALAAVDSIRAWQARKALALV